MPGKETIVSAEVRLRPGLLLALGQVRYQLLLLVRGPLGFFVTLVVPVLLLVCLNLLMPQSLAGVPDGMRYTQFLTPAISAFALLAAGYVNTLTGVVLAREEGILKRLRGTPLPRWAYLVGRLGSVLTTAVASVTVIIAIAVVFFDVTLVWHAFGYFVGAASLGIVTFFLLGVAVSTAVPTSDSALPVAYGTMLPLAFVSDVFFSSSHAPGWLQDLTSVLPVAPAARAMEAAFDPSTTSWPMPATGLLATLGWCAAAILVIATAFREAPGAVPRLRRRRPGR
jgi:ABC-2 type transport system permease protein